MLDPIYAIAHQVNDLNKISDVISHYSGIEIDIAYSNLRKKWVVAHHDFDNVEHYTLSDWLITFSKKYHKNKSKNCILWLDFKTLDDNHICDLLLILNKYTPSNVSLVYDLGRPTNILNINTSYKKILSNLRSIDGIGCWITKEDISFVSKVSDKLNTDKVKNTFISYGEVESIDLEVLDSLCKLNNSLPNPFSKLFVWNVEYQHEIKEFLSWQNISGQILGYKKQLWDKKCLLQLEYFNKLKADFKREIPSDFWD